LSGEEASTIWAGFQETLNTREKVETFNRIIAGAVADQTGKMPKMNLAMYAMNLAGAAILGDRPPDPNSTEAFLERATRAGILRRV
jgi:hypothetical protein